MKLLLNAFCLLALTAIVSTSSAQQWQFGTPSTFTNTYLDQSLSLDVGIGLLPTQETLGRLHVSSSFPTWGGLSTYNFGMVSQTTNSTPINMSLYATSSGASNSNFAVRGQAVGTAPNTLSYGIFGEAYGQGSTYAGWFQGAVEINGPLTVMGVSVPSDKRYKTNIRKFENALDKVLQLDVKRYQFTEAHEDINFPEGEQIGFMAQDLERFFPELITTQQHQTLNFETGSRNEAVELKTVNYLGLIPVLIKSMQEMQDQHESETATLRSEVQALKAIVSATDGADVGPASISAPVPNPARSSARIEYQLPESAKSASIAVVDLSGKEVQRVQLGNELSGTAQLNTSTLPAGVYFCNLLVNGSSVKSSKMVVNR